MCGVFKKTICCPRPVLIAALAALGCGGGIERYPVSGQVLIDGKPLSHGVIRVIPENAKPAASRLDDEGRFSLVTSGIGDGVPAGTHAVEVDGSEFISAQTVKWHAPSKYQHRKKSGLEMEIRGSTNDVKVELTWDGKRSYVQKF